MRKKGLTKIERPKVGLVDLNDLLHEILDLVGAAVDVPVDTVMLPGPADGESFPILRPGRHVIDHEIPLHVMVECGVGYGEGLAAMGAGPGEDGAVLRLLPHGGIQVDIDAVPAGELAGVAAGRAGDLMFAYLGHILQVFIREQRSSPVP